MADTVKVEYLYPPNLLDGDWDENQGNLKVIVRLSCISDGTGETDAIKIRLSDLKTHSGKVPARTVVEWIEYQITGLACVLEWDRSPNAEIIRLNGIGQGIEGKRDYTQFGGKCDPGGDDRSGNILMSTTGADSGDTYEINLCLRLKD